jgi:hypothetical protein
LTSILTKFWHPKKGHFFLIDIHQGKFNRIGIAWGDLAEETQRLLQGFLLLLHEHPTVIFTKHVAGENTNRQEVDSQISKSVKWWNLNSSPETKPHLVRICILKIIKLSDRRNWLLAHCPIANIPQHLKVGQLCCYTLCLNDYLHSDRTTIVYVSGCPNPFPLPVTSFSNMEKL